MRHELCLLKRLEFNDLDQDGGDPEMTPGNDNDLEFVLVSGARKERENRRPKGERGIEETIG
eukprot:scaffold18488_cov59-Cyclotella_meneghiniana.AAC.4